MIDMIPANFLKPPPAAITCSTAPWAELNTAGISPPAPRLAPLPTARTARLAPALRLVTTSSSAAPGSNGQRRSDQADDVPRPRPGARRRRRCCARRTKSALEVWASDHLQQCSSQALDFVDAVDQAIGVDVTARR